jgi:hypothetical protein
MDTPRPGSKHSTAEGALHRQRWTITEREAAIIAGRFLSSLESRFDDACEDRPSDGSALTLVLTFGLRWVLAPAKLSLKETQPFPQKGYENQEFA